MKNEKPLDDKQSFKRKRIKMYFLEAAKEIIIKEGVENVSVRKVADIAGYSYATIYNYFVDLNELLWDVKGMMIKDIAEIIQKKMPESFDDIDSIKRLFRIYIAYYLENPNVFKFFYFNQLNEPNKKTEEVETELNFDEMWKETFKAFVLNGTLNEKDIEVISKIFIYTVHGMLTLFFSKNGYMSEESVHKDLDKMVEYLLREKERS
jgi:AcrR family transcriptional regulator